MAKGDQFKVVNNALANNGTQAIQPSAGIIAFLKTIETTGAIEIYVGGTSTNPIFTTTSAMLVNNINYYLDNTDYITIKNVSGGNIYLKAKGMIAS